MKRGVFIESGPMDWQILQQVDGKSEISLSGSWAFPDELKDHSVYARVVKEESGGTVIPWTLCEETGPQQWRITLNDIPAGGLYRVETCLYHDLPFGERERAYEWYNRGDMIHHIGIGDLFIIAGQSNAVGYGKDPISDPPELGVHLLRNSGKWDLATHPLNESTNTVHEANLEGGNPGTSPYLNFAKILKKELGYPIGLLQSALGGTAFCYWDPYEDGYLYKNMVEVIRSVGSKIKGVLWDQGSGDTIEGARDTYLERFMRMVAHLREELKDPGIHVLTGQLHCLRTLSTEDEDIGWGKIKEAQRQAARQIPYVYVLPNSDGTLSDAIHYSSSHNLVLGERLAKTALKHIYGKNIRWDAPDLEEAKKTSPDSVTLKFSNVFGRLYTIEATEKTISFFVEDEDGLVGLSEYIIKAPDTIMLKLTRNIRGKCRVHGCYQKTPKELMPKDFETHLPVLSFYGVDITEN